MNLNEESLLEIRVKIVKLVEKLKRLETQEQQLLGKVEQLTLVIEDQKSTINILKDQNKIRKIAEALDVADGNKLEMKKTLSYYIREMDECIRLLSER